MGMNSSSNNPASFDMKDNILETSWDIRRPWVGMFLRHVHVRVSDDNVSPVILCVIDSRYRLPKTIWDLQLEEWGIRESCRSAVLTDLLFGLRNIFRCDAYCTFNSLSWPRKGDVRVSQETLSSHAFLVAKVEGVSHIKKKNLWTSKFMSFFLSSCYSSLLDDMSSWSVNTSCRHSYTRLNIHRRRLFWRLPVKASFQVIPSESLWGAHKEMQTPHKTFPLENSLDTAWIQYKEPVVEFHSEFHSKTPVSSCRRPYSVLTQRLTSGQYFHLWLWNAYFSVETS